MTQIKHHALITTIVMALVFTNTVLAADPATNENKNNSTSDTISDVYNAGHTDGDSTFSVERNINTSPCYQHKSVDHADAYQQMQQRRQQQQEAQLEAYKRFLEIRKQQLDRLNRPFANNYLPANLEAQHKTYVQNLEERRAFMEKMINERREAAAERRKTMQLKMHQTNITSALADKT